ncbi:MAG: hypothetical protein BroJett011_42690 [Chloroflexota bacterium]|nr:MAG: hypothetical protein BroJett011_42690 [Chloroflexota bacterium]
MVDPTMPLFNNLIPLYLYQGGVIPRPTYEYDYIIASQGVIKRLETEVVSADMILVPFYTELRGLYLQLYPLNVVFKLPRIPWYLLEQVLVDARTNAHLEFMYHFRFMGGQWHVTFPEQNQEEAWVGYYNVDPTGIALDLHSHNGMPPFFSPTDNKDERGGRFYGVIGYVDSPTPQIVLRLGMHGHWLINVPALLLFENIGPFVEIFLEQEVPHYGHAEMEIGGNNGHEAFTPGFLSANLLEKLTQLFRK